MVRIRFSDTARIDHAAAVLSIRNYFDTIFSPALGEKHVDAFMSEFKEKIQELKAHPMKYRVRDDGLFRCSATKFRSFAVHWFTVFYTYENDEVWILFIRSSISDYSNIAYMDQSRQE
ncbi:MAG: type II toxin-antitoxin system RelE/ParE family toxin [Clostridiales Family XIII bacterium]|jgi:hypothetical protein|nr:type II toxin-antitoxin system RelE/ParE family toxin [Clostridiales Family XIII bacterium]